MDDGAFACQVYTCGSQKFKLQFDCKEDCHLTPKRIYTCLFLLFFI
jgi:hypothetical protein